MTKKIKFNVVKKIAPDVKINWRDECYSRCGKRHKIKIDCPDDIFEPKYYCSIKCKNHHDAYWRVMEDNYSVM